MQAINAQLTCPKEQHLEEMLTWFHDKQAVFDWAGPNFRYPYSLTSFSEDLSLSKLASFALVSDAQQLIGFGQYYRRLDRCHLARIVISPKWRGKGLAKMLIEQLNAKGLKTLNVKQSSLFVLSHNHQAIYTYQKLGFVKSDYPEAIARKDCLYMIK
ncbi:GNAT family N-acetyltransferase [Shewanella abyssi]|uniref:GNAT family N-acetyltransferase n=1 Tax=Shewanella abyssi TaxID=311789 RepID=UPI00200FB2CE|nr:GNAT family N-acetyltransferase [Shewanella abyssi]MCL1048290.1 GNAT family N-acetyltransferase [Shewanella abyssi]